MSSYPTSRDYDELLRLMQAGHDLVCFVDYSMNGDAFSKEPPCRDIARSRYRPPEKVSYADGLLPYLAIQCRGICYCGGLRLSPEKFKADCAKVNLEFILPTLLVS